MRALPPTWNTLCGKLAFADMHELGIAENILQIVRQSVPEGQTAAVRRIKLRVGRLSGVVAESLDFCFGVMIGDTDMNRAGLDIEDVLVTSKCRECGNAFATDDFAFSCPACGGNSIEVVSGRELEIVEIELADESGEQI